MVVLLISFLRIVFMALLVLWSIHNPSQNLISCQLSKLIFHYPSTCYIHFTWNCLLFFFTELSVLISASAWPAWNMSLFPWTTCQGRCPWSHCPTTASYFTLLLIQHLNRITVEHRYIVGLLELLALPQTPQPQLDDHLVNILWLNYFNGPHCITSQSSITSRYETS